MIFNEENPYVTNRIDTQVTHPFFYTTRMRNKKKYFILKKFNNNGKTFLNNNNNLFLFSNQTFTLGCVTCVWIIGGFEL